MFLGVWFDSVELMAQIEDEGARHTVPLPAHDFSAQVRERVRPHQHQLQGGVLERAAQHGDS